MPGRPAGKINALCLYLHKFSPMKNAEKNPGSQSPVKVVAILTLSFLLSVSTCVLFVLSTKQRLSDEDYVYNFLKCTSESDSTAIPITGSFVVACFFCAAHLIFHSIFGIFIFSGKSFRRMHFRFYFSKSDSWPASLVKAVFCLPALFFIYDYARGY